MAKGGKIYLRVEQSITKDCLDKNVTIVAPKWVEDGLKQLESKLQGCIFTVEAENPFSFKIDGPISLQQLVSIARSEAFNTDGVIQFGQFEGIDQSTIIALRDLVKHCVIVGKDKAVAYGGYPALDSLVEYEQQLYLCDLPGLQFQESYNNGRLVLISKGEQEQGDLDNLIYFKTVGSLKPSYNDAKDRDRFIPAKFCGKSVWFDAFAFQSFVAQDYLLSIQALNEAAKVNADELNFRFLKYGTGFFADNLSGQAKKQLSAHVAIGVLRGLEATVKLPKAHWSQIKRIELPHFRDETDLDMMMVLKDIRDLCHKHGLEFGCKSQDALAPSEKYVVATTNCSDPHAPTGNEMNYGSVDAAIAENLFSKGNIFNPTCNDKMQSKTIQFDHKPQGTYRLLPSSNFNTALAFIGTTGYSALLAYGLFGFSQTVSLGTGLLGGVFVSGMTYIRERYMDNLYIDFKVENKTIHSKEEEAVFKIGQQANRSLITQAKSFFNKDCWTYSDAYYAGIRKDQSQDDKICYTPTKHGAK